MANNLFSLTYRSGFQRDGTTFQSKYCTDGQWVRFQRGHIKKIGGMKGVYSRVTGVTGLGYISSMFLLPFGEDIIAILGTTTSLYTYRVNPNWEYVANSTYAFINTSAARTVQTILINDNITNVQTIIWMVTNNLLNINDTSLPVFFAKKVEDLLTLGTPTAPMSGIDPRSNGGMCFVSQRLFLYGSNGFVQWSKTNSPFDFTLTAVTATGTGSTTTSGATDPNAVKLISDAGFTVLPTTEKIIYAASVRGGSTGTSILFWSLSSVIRGTNTGTTTFQLSSDVISSTSSIMSARSVVEYDGLFFWAGVDRFFVYNGVVSELPNLLNQNYFFDNVDMSQREKVFGVKNTKYGEIWWFYCDKRDNSTIPTRAIIFNKRENCWYDTAISRYAGYFSDNLGYMTTAGLPLISSDNNNHLWLHEAGSTQNWTPAGGAPAVHKIPSSFTTPTISWAAFPPGGGDQPSQLLDRWLTLQRIEPDFVTDGAPITFSINAFARTYAQSAIDTIPIMVVDKDGRNPTPNISTDLEMITLSINTRNISFQFLSSQNFEVGNIHFLFGIGDAQ